VRKFNALETPRCILILSAWDPASKPETCWLTDACAQAGRTDVLVYWKTSANPSRIYDGNLYIEYIEQADYTFLNRQIRFRRPIVCLAPWLRKLRGLGHTGKVSSNERGNYFEQGGDVPAVTSTGANRQLHTPLKKINDALYWRGRANSVPAGIIFCASSETLSAGARLKRIFNCQLFLYYTRMENNLALINNYRDLGKIDSVFVKETNQSVVKHLIDLGCTSSIITIKEADLAATFFPYLSPSFQYKKEGM
jgi:hypothetical protein